jgi:hypothetical protein
MLTSSASSWPRRRFLALLSAAPILLLAYSNESRANENPRLDPSSERAQSLHYTHDAESAAHSKRKPNARCATCTHFHGSADDTWSTCNIFPNRKVNAAGWCTSWFSAS